jgi:hypothetical protein
MSSQPLRHRISRQEIALGIPLDACTPMAGMVSSRAAAAIAGTAQPLCFHVASVTFEFSSELHEDAGQTSPTEVAAAAGDVPAWAALDRRSTFLPWTSSIWKKKR